MTMTEGFTINLDEDRNRRAAEREGGDTGPIPIILGGKTVAYLPPELPLIVLSPLRTLDEEITLLLRSAVTMWQEGGANQRDAQTLIVNLLAANPSLPSQVLDVIETMARLLIGDEGFEAMMGEKLYRNDLGFLMGGVMKVYGLSVGESSASSGSSTGDAGEQSNTTSNPSTESTPEASGDAPAIEVSSEPDASSD